MCEQFQRELEYAIRDYIVRTRDIYIGYNSGSSHREITMGDGEVVYTSDSFLDRMVWALAQPYGFGIKHKNGELFADEEAEVSCE
jgi:hypothetical protein